MARDEQSRGRSRVLVPALALAGLGLAGLAVAVNASFERSIRQPIPGAYVEAPPAPAVSGGLVKVALSAPAGAAGAAPAAAPTAATGSVGFLPPGEETIPDNDYGKMIRLGEQVFNNTGQFAAKYVGNDLNCVNCHLDAARKPNSAPLWGAFIHYPAYRSKTGKVDTLASRLQGCFQFSMNGKAPPQDDPIMTALQTYAAFLAQGAPVGMPVEGSGYPKLKKPAHAPNYVRGQQVYAQNCALCHGVDGQGQRSGGRQVFPPLWGSRSFNWGAGMHQVNTAAGFIYANMPLGKGHSLTEQQAWDVAYFMDAHERPQDPRFHGSVAETRKRYHDDPQSLYGLDVNGHVLGSQPARSSRTPVASR